MANYNKVILAGNLTKDPQLSYLPANNTPVVEFGMAINRKWKDQQGQQKDEVCFVDLRAYGRQAETINQYMRKGQPMLVEGRLQFSSWDGKDGQKHSKHRVIVEAFQFLGGPREGGAGGGGGGGGYRAPAPRPPQASQPPAAPPMDQAEPTPPEYDQGPGPGEGQGDNIPF